MALSISQLYFEHHVTALGIGESEPRISWRFEGDVVDWEQSAYDLEIQRPGDSHMPNVFRVNSSDSILVPWPDSPLESGEEATVRLRVYGQGDQPDSTWSDAVTVEPGLLGPEDWHDALTIAADRETEVDEPHQPILFRKEFSTSSSISSARLYITALGVYEAEINGQRVGDLVMAPGWQSYDHRHEYNTYDVTDLLEEGPNAIGVVVGEGWYSGRIGFDERVRNLWGDTLGLLSLLVLTDSQGNKTYITTDETWESTTGPIITSEIYDGEVYDSRLEQEGWSEPGFNSEDWIGVKELDPPKGELVAPDSPPVRRIEERRLENVITSPSGKTILDFGQNLVGWLRLQVEGPSGQTIQMVHTEVLENGEVATRPLRSAKATDNFTLSGDGVQTWEPKFTFHGFRYVQVDGWPADTPLDEESVVAVVVHSDMQETGWFECSNPLINKLHQNVRWSMKGNFLSIPTDCPQRDERLGWTGDIHAFSRTANFLYDTSGFLRGWLKDARFEQIASGANFPPYVVPDAMGTSTPVSIWGDVIVAAPWELYQTFGDDVMLKEQYVGAKAWIDEGIPRNGEGLWNRSTFQYGDWLDPKAPPEDAGDATTSAYLVSDAYLLHSTELLANISAYLSQPDDESYYNDWHSELAQEFRNAWISSNGTVANETQTGLALPLYFSLFDKPEHYTSALSRLVSIITENEFKVGTGFAGTHLLGHALTKYGESDTFYQMLLQTETPSWLYQVVMNATTTWERWDSMLPDGSINPGSMTSFNHYAVGSVAAWIHSVIGGLSPAEPGWKRINVEVIPGGELTEAKTQFLSPYGMVSTDWWFGDGSDDGKNAPGFHLVVEVPPNTRADVKLPAPEGGDGEVKEVGSGTHEYHVPGLEAR